MYPTLWRKAACLVVASAICASTQSNPSAPKSCGDPILVPVRNISLNNGVVRRGIAVSLGTPPQNLSFGLDMDGTWIKYMDSNIICKDEYVESCSAAKGGFFNSAASSTWDKANETVLDFYPQMDTLRNGRTGIDEMHLGDSVTTRVLVGSNGKDYSNVPHSTFGLGLNSTFLNDLYASGTVPSHSWSYYAGREFGNNPSDGSFVLGGYDEAAIDAGSNFTTPFSGPQSGASADCVTQHLVTVSDITITFKNGTRVSIFDDSSTRYGCFLPTYDYVAELPPSIVNVFLSKSGSTQTGNSTSPLSWNFMQLDPISAFDGNITFNLNNGDFSTTIPHDQFITPQFDIQDNVIYQNLSTVLARLTVLNATDKGQYQPGQRAMRFGTSFFSAAMMITDYDRNRFTLANTRDSDQKKLVPIPGTNGTCKPSTNLPEGSLVSPDDDPAANSSGIPRGAIAGIVIGVIAGFALLLLLAWFFWRRKKATKLMSEPTTNHYPSTDVYPKSELNGGIENLPRQEMPNQREPSGTLPPVEMGGEEKRAPRSELASVQGVGQGYGWASELPSKRESKKSGK